MHADAGKLLRDARQAGEWVAHFTRGKAFDDYLADELLRSAVERQLEIVGEALGRLSRLDPETAAAIALARSPARAALSRAGLAFRGQPWGEMCA